MLRKTCLFTKENISSKLLRLLVKEDINLKNLSIKKDKLNNLVGTYLQENKVDSKQRKNYY